MVDCEKRGREGWREGGGYGHRITRELPHLIKMVPVVRSVGLHHPHHLVYAAVQSARRDEPGELPEDE